MVPPHPDLRLFPSVDGCRVAHATEWRLPPFDQAFHPPRMAITKILGDFVDVLSHKRRRSGRAAGNDRMSDFVVRGAEAHVFRDGILGAQDVVYDDVVDRLCD